MTLSFNKLNEIAELYESIAASEQEQLNEGGGIGAGIAAQQAAKQKAQVQGTRTALNTGKSIGLAGNNAGQNVGSLKLNSAETKKSGRSTLAITPDKDTKPYMNKDSVYGNKRTIGGDTYYRATLKGKDVFVSGKKSGTQQPTQQPQRQPTQQPQRQPAAGAPATKPAPTASAKVIPSKPAGSAMDQWAKANPKLATAAAEKARIRGTNQTDNPLMKGMRSSLPAPTSSQSPAVAKLGAGNQSLTSNPNVPKSASASSTLGQATAAASKPPAFNPAASGSVVSATNKIAATKTPTPVAPTRMPLAQSFEYDAYDLVLEYLFDNGHVDTVEEAHYIMMELDAEVIQDIVEEVLDEDANYDRNRKRAAQRAAARNAARDAGKTGAVPGVGYVTPRRESETYRDSTGTERHKSGAKMPEKKG